jgi:hypothetical protein
MEAAGTEGTSLSAAFEAQVTRSGLNLADAGQVSVGAGGTVDI